MSRVRRIHAQPQLTFTPAVANTVRSGKLRVAAYARVSTTMDQQANSFQAQKEYYERLIEKTQGWSFAGIYADHGISGTSADRRDGFQKMMEDCRVGLIDRILTKSISRFARNTVDSLNAIRELKSLGIGILFEKEKIFTLDSRGEFLIDDCSKNVAIDGHVIRSCSMENDLAEPGYKLQELKASQVNVLIAYDIKKRIPLMYRTYRGSSVDKKSVEDLLESRSFKNTKFMVDRGFFSETVLDLMSKDGNCYIIPLAVSNKNVKRIKKTLQYTSGEFVYKSGRKDTARIIYYEERIDESTRIIVYKDVDENNSKRKSYKQLMDMGENSYTQDNYDKYCDWWGVYFLQTTTKDPAPVVYSDYKGRWSIETYNNYVKNDADFNDLKFQGYYEQHGFDFIMLVTGIMHEKLNEAVKLINKSSVSTFDVLIKAGHMRMVKREENWQLHNTRTKDLALLEAMGFVPDESYPL